MPYTGPDLRADRRAAEITVVDIAARMGLSRQAVHVLEGSAVVKTDRALAYLAALRDAKTAARDVA